jgi:long-chain acyl-CoA synthetase
MMASTKSLLCVLEEEMPNAHKHCYISYLPLGHMFEFIAEIFCIGTGVKMGYASALTLIDGSPNLSPGDISDIKLLKPTFFLSVPLVLDRIRRGIIEQAESSPLSRRLFKCFIDYKDFWRMKGYKTPICNYFLCHKARQQLGGNLSYMLVGGAPVSCVN